MFAWFSTCQTIPIHHPEDLVSLQPADPAVNKFYLLVAKCNLANITQSRNADKFNTLKNRWMFCLSNPLLPNRKSIHQLGHHCSPICPPQVVVNSVYGTTSKRLCNTQMGCCQGPLHLLDPRNELQGVYTLTNGWSVWLCCCCLKLRFNIHLLSPQA